MRTIVDGNEKVKMLLGKQAARHGMYRLMTYVIPLKSDSGMLLHNVITGQMVMLNDDEERAIDSLPTYYNGAVVDLVEGLYLVPESFQEEIIVDRLRTILGRLFSPRGINSYVIFPTTDCNARCYYCFENNLKRFSMNDETSDGLIEYILENKGSGIVHLDWFGGEPLLAVDRISKICKDLSNRGVSFYSTMISNGFLFSPTILDEAVDCWKLDKVQITLDGTEKEYNQVKAYVGVIGSAFSTVMGNIRASLCRGIKVVIRLNLDLSNADDLAKLIDELASKFSGFKNLQVYVRAIQKDTGYLPIHRSTEAEQKLYEKQVEFTKKLKSLGLLRLDPHLPSIKLFRCLGDNPGMVAVYPDGRIYKCENVTETENAGNIFTSGIDEAISEVYREHTELPECRSCPLYPSCILLKRCPANEVYGETTCKYNLDCVKEAMQYRLRLFEKNIRGENFQTAIDSWQC